MSFTGRSVGWVASVGPDQGLAQVLIDGKLYTVVNLQATVAAARHLVFVRTWAVAGKHTITIRLLGTSSHPRVDVDALVLIR